MDEAVNDTERTARRPRRWRRRLLRVALVLLAVCALLWVFRTPLLGPLVVRAADHFGRRHAGLAIEIDRVGGSWVGGLVLDDVRVHAVDDEMPLRLLVAERVEVDYALGRLVGGDLLGGLDSVALAGAEIEIDTTRGAETDPTPPREGPLELPARLPAIDVERGELRLTLGPDSGVHLRGLDVETLAADPRTYGLAADATLTLGAGAPRQTNVRAEVVVTPERFDVTRLELDGEELLRDSHVELGALAEGVPRGRVSGSLGGGTFDVDADVRDDAYELRFDARGVDLERAAERIGVALPAQGTVSVSGRASVPRRRPSEASVDATLEARDVRVDEPSGAARADEVSARVRLEDGQATVEDLALVRDGGRITAERVSAPLLDPNATGELELVPPLRMLAEGRVEELDVRLVAWPLHEPQWRATASEIGATLSLEDGVVRARDLVLEGGDSRIEAQSARVPLIDPLAAGDPALLPLDVMLAEADVQALDAHVASWPASEPAWLAELWDEREVVADVEGSFADGAFAGDVVVTSLAGRLALDAESIAIAGEAGSLERPAVDADVVLTLANLAPWTAPHDLPIAARDVRVDASVAGRWPELGGTARVAAAALVVGERELGPVYVEARGAVGADAFHVAELTAKQATNYLVATDLRVPRAQSFAALASGWSGTVQLDAPDLGAWFDDPVASGPRARLEATLEPGGLAVDRGRVAVEGAAAVLRSGALTLDERDPSDLARAVLALDLDVQIDDLAPLGELLDPGETWSGSVAGSLRVAGTLEEPAGTVSLTSDGAVVHSVQLDRVILDASLAGSTLVVAPLRVRRGADRLRVRGTFDLERRSIEDADLELSLADIAPYLPGRDVAGSIELSAAARGPLARPEGFVALDARSLRLGEHEVGVVTALATSANERVELDAAARRTPIGDVAFSAHAEGWGAGSEVALTLDTLDLTAGGDSLSLAAPVPIRLDGGLAFEELRLAGDAGALRASVGQTSDGWAFGVQLERLRPTPFLGTLVPRDFAVGTVDGSFEAFVGPSTTASGRLAIAELRPYEGAPPLDVLLRRSSFGGNRLELEGLRVVAGPATWLEASASLSVPQNGERLLAAPLALELRAEVADLGDLRLEQFTDGRAVLGSLRASVDLEGSWNEPRGSVAIACERLSLRWEVPGLPVQAPPVTLNVAATLGERVVLDDVALRAPDGSSVTLSGELGWSPTLAPAEIDLATDLVIDAQSLDWLQPWLPDVRRLAGRAHAEATARGTLATPVLAGWIEVSGAQLKLETELPAIAHVDARVSLESRRVEIETLTGTLGGAPFRVTGSLAVPAEPEERARLALELEGENLLLQRRDGVKVRADADLRIAGPLDALVASGTIRLRDSLYARRLDPLEVARGSDTPGGAHGPELYLFSFRSPPLADLAFDVRVETAEPFRIANNVLQASLRPQLHLGGTGEVPVITGPIFLDRAKLSLPASTLTFPSGTITFDASAPFVPRLDLLGRTRMRGYDVSLRVNGPYHDPEIELSSVPPLGHQALRILLLTGQAPDSGLSRKTGVAAAESVAVFLATDIFSSWFGSASLEDDDDESLIERFDFVSGRDVSRTGAKTIEATFLLTEELLLPRDTLYLTAERDVYDDYNLGTRLVFEFE